jgi:hypothetical protein
VARRGTHARKAMQIVTISGVMRLHVISVVQHAHLKTTAAATDAATQKVLAKLRVHKG